MYDMRSLGTVRLLRYFRPMFRWMDSDTQPDVKKHP